MKTCKLCEHFRKKSYLDKHNNILTKNICSKFKQEIYSLNPCKKYEEVDNEPTPLHITVGMFSLILFVGGLIASCYLYFVNGWNLTSMLVILATLFCFFFFLVLTPDEKDDLKWVIPLIILNLILIFWVMISWF